MKPKVSIVNYIDFIEQFLKGRISSVEAFRGEYNKLFYREQEDYSDTAFHILDALFADLDSYWPECRPEDEAGDKFGTISEQTLRARRKHQRSSRSQPRISYNYSTSSAAPCRDFLALALE